MSSLPELPWPVLAIVIDLIPISSLLSLSLTCKTLRAYVSPYPLEFTIIESTFAHPTLWKLLAESSRLAEYVRHLKIDSRQTFTYTWARVPNVLPVEFRRNSEDADNAEDLFTKALRNMKRLESFTFISDATTPLSRQVSEAFASLPPSLALRIYERSSGTVKPNLLGMKHEPPVPVLNSLTWNRLCGLRDFDWRWWSKSDQKLQTRSMEEMLVGNCPDLESLSIAITVADEHTEPSNRVSLDILFSSRTFWPKLTSLSLYGTSFASEDFIAFLEAHLWLEEIAMEWPDHLLITGLRDSALPRLRSVDITINQPAKALPLIGARRPLEHIGGYWFVDEDTPDGSLASSTFFSALHECQPVLKALIIPSWRNRQTKAPLDKLVHPPFPLLSKLEIKDCSFDMDDALSLPSLPSMRTLWGIAMPSAGQKDLRSYAQTLVERVAPSLQVFRYFSQHPFSMNEVEIQRNGAAVDIKQRRLLCR